MNVISCVDLSVWRLVMWPRPPGEFIPAHVRDWTFTRRPLISHDWFWLGLLVVVGCVLVGCVVLVEDDGACT